MKSSAQPSKITGSIEAQYWGHQ